jgi:hypothetical protein
MANSQQKKAIFYPIEQASNCADSQERRRFELTGYL